MHVSRNSPAHDRAEYRDPVVEPREDRSTVPNKDDFAAAVSATLRPFGLLLTNIAVSCSCTVTECSAHFTTRRTRCKRRCSGRDAGAEFFATVPSGGALDRFRLVRMRANHQPALAVYRLKPDTNTYGAWAIWVLTLDGDAIAEITAFVDATLFPRFGLSAEVDTRSRPV